jgi:hypothetical protein
MIRFTDVAKSWAGRRVVGRSPLVVASALLLTACDPVQNASINARTQGEAVPRVEADLADLGKLADVTRTREWISDGNGGVVAIFDDPAKPDALSISVVISRKPGGAVIEASAGGAGSRANRLPLAGMARIKTVLTRLYGARNVVSCRNAFC